MRRSCHVLVGFRVRNYLLSFTILSSFAGTEASSAYVSVMQTAFPLTSILSSHSNSRLPYLLFLFLTHSTRFIFFWCKTILYAHVFLTHVLPSHC